MQLTRFWFTSTSLTMTTLFAHAAPADSDDWKAAVGWNGTVLHATVIGIPLNNTVVQIHSRAADHLGGVYICTDINWEGDCGYAVQPLNTCIVLGKEWNNQISSFGPDSCNRCFAYDDAGCELTGIDSWVFTYPGDATGGLDLNPGPIGGPWNDKFSSFLCYEDDTAC